MSSDIGRAALPNLNNYTPLYYILLSLVVLGIIIVTTMLLRNNKKAKPRPIGSRGRLVLSAKSAGHKEGK